MGAGTNEKTGPLQGDKKGGMPCAYCPVQALSDRQILLDQFVMAC